MGAEPPRDLFLVHLGDPEAEIVEGPDVVRLGTDLYVVRSLMTRSRVYHDVKRRTRPQRLLVAPLADLPKFKGMDDGATTRLKAMLAAR